MDKNSNNLCNKCECKTDSLTTFMLYACDLFMFYDLCRHWKCYSYPCHSEGCWPPLTSQRHIWRPRLTPTKCSCDCSTSTANVSQESSMLGYNHTSLTWHIMTQPSTRPATALRSALAQVAKQQTTGVSLSPTWGKAQYNDSDKHGRPQRWQGVPLQKTKNHPLPLPILVTQAASAHPSHPLFLPVSGHNTHRN